MARFDVRLIAICLGLAVSLAARAHAGSTINPIQGDACGDILVAQDNMGDPSAGPYKFAPAKDCQKLCGKAASACKALAKKEYSCHLRLQDWNKSHGEADCRLFPVGGLQMC